MDDIILQSSTLLLGSAEPRPVILGVGNAREERGNIDTLGLGHPCDLFLTLLQQVSTADNVLKLGVAQVGHELTDLLSNELEEVHDVLGSARELLPELLLLGGHADGAGVQVTDAGHDAPLGDHGDGPKSVLLRSHHGTDGNVPASSDATVDADHNTIAQSIVHEGRVRFRETQFPRASRVLDRAEGGGSRAAIAARDLNDVGVRLGNAAGDGADADGGDELH
mmetsp:Transcript_33276/g.99007  ORF Transcript_33276/g.99007 Transcript_33276/m.99007 type:complete len:223 (-) Transcript_33276:3778-4446(-)